MTLPAILAVVVRGVGAVLLGGQPAEMPKTGRIYSVCEVLADLKSLNGKILSIRGTISGGGQGAFLVGKCPSKLVVKGLTWPDVVWLTFPSTPGTPFEADFAAYERVQKTIKTLHPRKSDEIVMTYIGMLETADLAARTFLNRADQLVGIGFGPQNVAPAQLVIQTVMDPSVVRKDAHSNGAFGPKNRSPKQ